MSSHVSLQLEDEPRLWPRASRGFLSSDIDPCLPWTTALFDSQVELVAFSLQLAENAEVGSGT